MNGDLNNIMSEDTCVYGSCKPATAAAKAAASLRQQTAVAISMLPSAE